MAGRDQPLTLSASESAKLLGISRAHFYRLHAAGQVPRPVRLGRAVRWVRQEIEEWLRAGAPPRVKWETMKRRPKKPLTSL
jgi:excisionase family DNA binding protein